MKTKLLLLLLLANFSIYAQYTAIPDANFEKKLIALKIDSGAVDGQVLTASISTLIKLDVSNSSITDLSGIEAFTSLTELSCHYNQLTALDVSKNINLTKLLCINNKLTTLNLTGAVKLVNLDCYNNQLTNLDISTNTALNYLSASNNKLSNLDVTKNILLYNISCSQNLLTSIDLTKNTVLSTFSCDNNNITSLNTSNNPALSELSATQNNLSSLDLSKNLNLTSLRLYMNRIKALDVSKNVNLKSIDCSSNSITSLNVSANTNLVTLGCSQNVLTSLDISNNYALKNLDAGYNKLTSLNTSANLVLDYLNLNSNKFTTLNVSANTVLTWLECSSMTLTSLDLTKNTLLKDLDCSNNQLTSLNVSKNSSLEKINCNTNKLTTLDVSKNILLNNLACKSNKIAGLDFSKNRTLTYLDCSSNSLLNINLKNGKNTILSKASLNFQNNPTLTCIQVDDATYSNSNWTLKDATTTFNTDCNQYTYIPDTAFEDKLISLGIDTDGPNGMVLNTSIIAIPSLDISNSTIIDLTGIEGFKGLTQLNCSNNSLKSLNLSQNAALNSLNSANNKSLTCIQVANVENANKWTIIKDDIATFNIDCAVYTLIPDPNFEDKLIALGLDSGARDGKVLTSNISSITNLNVGDSSINNLTGIQDFTALKILNTSSNPITALDLSKNIALINLYCYSNSGSAVGGGSGKLTSLDLSKNVNLQTLVCRYNQLTSLDISTCNQLTYLDCNINNLPTLDIVSTKLTYLDFGGNPISTIDVTKNLGLKTIGCEYTKLKTLNLTHNTALESLDCANSKLTSLDLSNNPNLTYFYCQSNDLLNLNLNNNNNIKLKTGSGTFKNNPNLTCIQVDDVNYSVANWSSLKDTQANYSASCPLNIAYTAIPDVNFEEKLISLGIDNDGKNGKVPTSRIDSITQLNVSNSNIKDLTGIQDFTILSTLNCSNNQLIALNLAQNSSLKNLNCSKNELKTFTISSNLLLSELNISSNKITAIDLSKNNKLSILNSSYNNMLNLDVSKNPNLTFLSCGFNQLANLDVSKNLVLKEIECSNNNIYNLNLKNGNNANMQRMIFGNFTNNPNLECIQVDDAAYSKANWIAKDDSASYSEACTEKIQYTLIPDVNFEKELIKQGIDSGEVDGKIITSKINKLTSLNVRNASITDMKGVEDFVSLTNLWCSGNKISALDVSKNSYLQTLNCDNNTITSLDVSKNLALETLSCSSNQISSLNLSGNAALGSLSCSSNQLQSLDISANQKLVSLNCGVNKFTDIDISKNIALKIVSVTSSNMTSINVSNNINLTSLNIYNNKITALNVSKNTALTYLDCTYNELSSLNVSKNIALTELYCHTNKIINLDVSKNTALTKFSCGGSSNLKSVNFKNGNNIKVTSVSFTSSPNLSCIQVDDVDYAIANWNTKKDAASNYNSDCAYSTAIPDLAFEQKLIDLGIDTDGKNGKVLTANISNLTDLDISNSNISDLTGIEDFSSLELLSTEQNNLTKLDVSKNLNLIRLTVSQNKLTSLLLTNNKSLQSLYCNDNLITGLDLSKNQNLREIYCPNNKLVSLNLKNGNNAASNGPGIKNFTNNPDLTCIMVDDVSYSNTNWQFYKDATANYSVNCDYSTAIPDIKFEKKLIALGIDTDGENGKVATANIMYLTTLDVSSSEISDLTGIQDFLSLKSLNLKSNKVTSLNVSKNTNLTTLDCSVNQLAVLDVQKNSNLNILICNNNLITVLDLSKNTKLNTLTVSNNQLVSLDLSQHKELVSFNCYGNKLESLNLKNGKNASLKNADFYIAGNSKLYCVLVDDVIYANTNWLNKKDEWTKYNTECTGELTLPANNFTVETKAESCLGENNGEISIVAKTAFAYTATVNDKPYAFVNNSLKVAALAPGVYKIKITIPDVIFEQNFNITIAKGATITGKSSITAKKVDVEITEGTAPFTVFVDGNEQFQTTDSNFSIALTEGGLIEVTTAKACEGIYAKNIKTTEILGTVLSAYPNPTTGIFEIEIPTSQNEVRIELYNFGGQLVSGKTYVIENGTAKLNLENQPSGIYAAKIYLETPEFIKIIKK